LRVSADFKPKLGQGGNEGVTLSEFQQLYGADAFYHWFGLDSPLMYSAHRVSGGMTSIYRQLGIGCQLALNLILRDQLNLTKAQANWSFIVPTPTGKSKKLSLDARIPIADVDPSRRHAIERWLTHSAAALYKPSTAVQ